LSARYELERYGEAGRRLAPFVCDAGDFVRAAWRDGQRILFEAAQGVMLDIDAGTYPYVTSSNTGTTGIPAGVGFPPRGIERSIGIAKAYCTRVGEGPFPSELADATGDRIRAAGNEYGATTGRPRRCGWFDAVAVRYALELNGADGLIVTNLDVLSGFDEVRAAVAYRRGRERWTRYPAHLASLSGIEPVVEGRPGWSQDISGARRFEDLPVEAREYVAWLEALVGSPVLLISVGPERQQVIRRGL
jgi:adenylosuccinate synthase